ncbi:uncharacterized protein BDZ83DRAFT_626481 [Colletotrichum acutatum]|uniref:Uncharacterized protein n=1 Tax=Glomerella acutata TaxID=27357 RepID=A0AAD8XHC2_GLOAC|nr:uncharacterized protein BDZ83DRAFT_626481 [Colletotrichum acutatum]KAK1723360.1 hypothetical protein BDZ83DRAFT_626481 [Colletotrichum acutatum]
MISLGRYCPNNLLDSSTKDVRVLLRKLSLYVSSIPEKDFKAIVGFSKLRSFEERRHDAMSTYTVISGPAMRPSFALDSTDSNVLNRRHPSLGAITPLAVSIDFPPLFRFLPRSRSAFTPIARCKPVSPGAA